MSRVYLHKYKGYEIETVAGSNWAYVTFEGIERFFNSTFTYRGTYQSLAGAKRAITNKLNKKQIVNKTKETKMSQKKVTKKVVKKAAPKKVTKKSAFRLHRKAVSEKYGIAQAQINEDIKALKAKRKDKVKREELLNELEASYSQKKAG